MFELPEIIETETSGVPGSVCGALVVCAYSGVLNAKCISLPALPTEGLYFSEKFKGNAFRDCYQYCIKHNIFPLGENFTSIVQETTTCLLGTKLSDIPIKVKNEEGEIEIDWHVGFHYIDRRTFWHDDSFSIFVFEKKQNIEKQISLQDFCEWNGINQIAIVNAFQEDLKSFYRQP